MIMLPKHLNATAIFLDMALLGVAMDAALSLGPLLWHHHNKTVIVSWNTRRPGREPRRGDRGPSIDYLLDFKVICAYFREMTPYI